MSHGATVGGQTHTQTRKQANAGKKTGVAGRRSRWTKEGKIGGLGESLRVTQSPNPFDLKPSVKKFFNNFSHEWFGTNKNTFPFEHSPLDSSVEQPFEPPKEVVEEPKTPMWIMPDAPISLPSHSFGSPPPTAKSIINKRTVAKRMGGY